MSTTVSMNSVSMSSLVVDLLPKSQTRRINNLRSKLSALERDLAEALKENEAFESLRSKNVTKRERKGRPKVAKVADESEDLFANLALNSEVQVDHLKSNVDDVKSNVDDVNSNVVEEVIANLVAAAPKSKSSKPKAPKHVLSDEEKAAKKAELDAEKAAKKIKLAEAKKLQLAAEKAEKEAMAIADKESKKKELEDAKIAKTEAKKKELEDAKIAKAEAKKKELEDAKALKKQELDAAKALKKAEEKAKKDALKPVKETKAKATKAKATPAVKKSKKTETTATACATTTTVNTTAAEEVPVEKVTVSRITINGVKYLKSSTGVLYNQESKEEVGLYDEETGTIKPLPDDEDEEVTEDTYESDSE